MKRPHIKLLRVQPCLEMDIIFHAVYAPLHNLWGRILSFQNEDTASKTIVLLSAGIILSHVRVKIQMPELLEGRFEKSQAHGDRLV